MDVLQSVSKNMQDVFQIRRVAIQQQQMERFVMKIKTVHPHRQHVVMVMQMHENNVVNLGLAVIQERHVRIVCVKIPLVVEMGM